MGTVKKGQLSFSLEYAKHLRKWRKRFFWKKERAAEKKLIKSEKEKLR